MAVIVITINCSHFHHRTKFEKVDSFVQERINSILIMSIFVPDTSVALIRISLQMKEIFDFIKQIIKLSTLAQINFRQWEL